MHTPSLIQASLFVNTYVSTTTFFLFSGLLILVLVFIHEHKNAKIFTLALIANTAVVTFLKYIFATPRPTDALVQLDSYAFPSGHAASAMFLAVTITWLYLRKRNNKRTAQSMFLVAVLFCLALFVGYSRIVIGVHTWFQVITGFVIGIVVPIVCIYLLERKLRG